MKPPKFTFKRQPRDTGLAAVANPYPAVDIKLKGEVVGSINPPPKFSNDPGWRVRFMVVSDSERCGWAWTQLKARFESEEAARTFIVDHSDVLLEKLKLYALCEKTTSSAPSGQPGLRKS